MQTMSDQKALTVLEAWFSDPVAAARAIESFRSEEGASRPSTDYYVWTEAHGEADLGSEASLARWLSSPARLP